MELVLIEIDSPEWNYMWEWLSYHPINKEIEDPTTAFYNNEAWQYMGSFKQENKVLHTFRHRNHPRNGQLVNLTVNASDEFTTDQINKKFKL